MVKSASTRAALLPYPIIAAAVRGEPDAVNTVIRHYSGYIAALSTRTSYDVHGCLIPMWMKNCAAGGNEADYRHPGF